MGNKKHKNLLISLCCVHCNPHNTLSVMFLRHWITFFKSNSKTFVLHHLHSKISTSIIIWRRKWDCDHPIANQSNYRHELHRLGLRCNGWKVFHYQRAWICYSNSLTQVLHWLNGCCGKNSNEAFFFALVRNGKSIAIYIVALTLMLRTGSFEHCECSCKSRRRLFDSCFLCAQAIPPTKSNDAELYFKSNSTLRIESLLENFSRLLHPAENKSESKKRKAESKITQSSFLLLESHISQIALFSKKKSYEFGNLLKVFSQKGLLFA